MKNPSKIIRFDSSIGKLERPTLLLRSRTGSVIGKLKYENLQISFIGKGMDQMSFEVHRFVDGEECEFWDRIIDLCIIDYVGYGQFEADVNISDEQEIIKTVNCKSLENELAQQILRNFHINDTDAITVIEADNFKSTVFCDFNDVSHSLLHRALADKAPHWKIGYVSEYFNINGQVSRADQLVRVFTVDGQSIYDFFEGDVVKEFSCVFVYDTYNRVINCYNLDECVYKVSTMKAVDNYVYIDGDIYDNTSNLDEALLHISSDEILTTYDDKNIVALVCKYDRNKIKYIPSIVDSDNKITATDQYGYCPGIGKDTNIIVSNKLLSKSFNKDSDSGQIKNCFYVTGGDDVINSYVGAANGSGKNYIYLFDNFQYEDMGGNLASAIHDYAVSTQEKREEFNADGGVFVYDPSCIYDSSADCCRDSSGKVLPTARHVDNKVYVKDGYSYCVDGVCYDKDDNAYESGDALYVEGGLFTKYANMCERMSYLEHTKFPDVTYPDTTAENEKDNIINYFDGGNKVYIQYTWSEDSFDHVTNTIEALIRTVCDMRYDIKILRDTDNAPTCTNPSSNIGTWTGNVEVTRQSDDEDTETFELECSVQLITQAENIDYCQQKINITIAKMDIAELNIEELEEYVEVTPVGTENPKDLEWFEKFGSIYKVSDDKTVAQGKTYYRLDFVKLENLMKQYNLESLKSFSTSFDNCMATLTDAYNNLGVEEGRIVLTSESTKVVRHIYTKRKEVVDEILKYRQSQVDDLYSQIDIISKQIEEFRSYFDIKAFLDEYNTDYYYQFLSYIREDEYNNQNYTSEGLTDSEILYKAKELLECAKKELSTACCIQYKISGDLNNIFAIKELETLHDDFSLFNYIRVKVDNKIHKLRLIEISFSDQSPENLNVTFSEELTSIDGSIDDTKNILSASVAMATTYSSTVRQAQEGSAANKTFSDIRQEGLDSSLYLINNSPEQVMTFDRKGLLGRSMLDEGVYLDDQMILTANGLYFSQDAFRSVCTAIGKFKYNNEWVYGINAEYIIGKFIIGENIVAQSDDKCVTLNGDGISIKKDVSGTLQTVFSADTNGNAELTGKITANDGVIGGWTIGATYLQKIISDTDMIKLDATNKSIITVNGYNKSELTSGYLKLHRGNNPILTVRPTSWTGDAYTPANGKYGAELASESISKFISFGNVDEPYVAVNPDGNEDPSSLGWYEYDSTTNTYSLSIDTSVDTTKLYYKLSYYSTNMILNYGLNPFGYIEGMIVFTDQKVIGNMRTIGRLYLDTESSAGYHFDRYYNNGSLAGIKTNGSFGIDGSAYVSGDVVSGNGTHTLSSKLKAEDNIQKIKWENVTLNGDTTPVARPVLYVGNQRFILYGEFGT